MKARSLRRVLAVVALTAVAAGARPAPGSERSLSALRRGFTDPPADTRIMMRWWWFGPSVTDAELTRELRAMRDAGIGGVETQPVYPVSLDDEATGVRVEPFLSEAFLAHLGVAARAARDLDLRMDLTVGSGWPFGGPGVPISDAAGRLRVVRIPLPPGTRQVPLPEIGPGERFLAAFALTGTALERGPAAARLAPAADGTLALDADSAAREILVAVASRTHMMVKRAAVGAEGFVIDHYDRGALDRYLSSVGDRLLTSFGGLTPPRAVFCDSLEVYDADWTGDLPAEFRRRRGYDLLPLLPSLIDGDGEQAAAVRHDWGRTLTELLNERFLAPLDAWAHGHGTPLRAQAYGTPPAAPSSARLVDLPEGEGSAWRELAASRWAASASHLAGVPVASSETWTWLDSPAFMATPLDLKAEADRHFLQGINQLVGHGWPYSPPGVPEPGWHFYAAAALNDHNPWWTVMPDVARTLQRSSAMLRQGTPVNDVALFLPVDDAWSQFAPGRVALIDEIRSRIGTAVIPAILDAGFNFDLVDRYDLERGGAVESGALRLGPRRYPIVVLPNVERMEPGDLALLDRFARTGGTLIAVGRLPSLAPGYLATPDDHAGVRRVAERLFTGPERAARLVRAPEELSAALAAALQPDVVVEPRTKAIGVVHRKTEAADIFFVANTSGMLREVTARFRVTRHMAEWWDPVRGTMTPIATAPSGSKQASVALELPPYGSGFVVFADVRGNRRQPPGPAPARAPESLGGDWHVTFAGLGVERTVSALDSWTAHDDTRYFSGIARYERAFDLDAAAADARQHVVLDFGAPTVVLQSPLVHGMRAWLEAPVREAAVVFVNGSRAGTVWCPPYEVSLDGLLLPGRNTLRIEVANLAVNGMAGHALPDYALLNRRYGVRFEPQDMDRIRPMPSGLLEVPRLVWR